MALDTWSLEETRFDEEFLARSESLFSIGNGYLGFRGFFCEREMTQHPGVFINGFYELSPIHYGEDAYGFARFNQTMVDLPDCRFVSISVDGNKFSMANEGIESYRKRLDFRTGVLSHEVVWRTPEGKKVDICWNTLLSMEHQHVGALRLVVQCDRTAIIVIRSAIALPAHRAMAGLDPRVGTMLNRPALHCIDSGFSAEGDGRLPAFQAAFKTVESALHLSCGAVHNCTVPGHIERFSEGEANLPGLLFTIHGTSVELCKCFYYHTSGRPGEALPLQQVRESRLDADCFCWEDLLASQRKHFDEFWKYADIEIDGDGKMQQALRFNLFQLHQSTGTDGMSSLAAKGLTGSGYEGHYFWDTEIYGMPFFNHTHSRTARALIRYRISILDHARSRARELAQKGALYPWRTINGLEASAYFPAGTAQYHINADIAYSIFQYLEITGDESILDEGAAEVLFETARTWYDLGYFNPRKQGRFCINEVTGPDEYSALIDNNCYTNLMAQHQLSRVCTLAAHLKADKPDLWGRLQKTMGLEEAELEEFAKAAVAMHVPFDSELGINPQDDYFLEKEEWNATKRGELRHPMLLNYHPLVIYRHRVIKQADTVLATLLLHDKFPWYLRKRNFDFYEPLTTGDSSLSACIQGIMAFDCGYVDLGDTYSRQTALMDIDDLHRNTKDGLHTAAMAGSWMAVVYGVAGYRLHDGMPTFRPQLPSSWNRVRFSLTFGSVTLSVSIDPKHTTYEASGGSLQIRHRSETAVVGPDPVVLSSRPRCKAVVFDLDGVVTSTDSYHYRAWKRLADEQGWAFDETVNQKLRGISRRQSLQVILDYNHVMLDEDAIQRFTTRKNEWYRSSLDSLTPGDILPGIGEVLSQLRSKGIRTAIASASRNASHILKRLQLKDSFDAVVPASEVVKGKPDPEVFARAADMLGLCPEECCGVEDAPAGIEAINAAMMRSVGVGSAIDPQTCTAYVDSTDKLTLDMLLF